MSIWGPSDILPDTPSYDLKKHVAYVQDLWRAYKYNNVEACKPMLRTLAEGAPSYVRETVILFMADFFSENDIFVLDMPTLEYAPYLTMMQKRLTRDPDRAIAPMRQFLDELYKNVPSDGTGTITLPFWQTVKASEYIGFAIHCFYSEKVGDVRLFPDFNHHIDRNIIEASGYDYDTYDGKKKTIKVEDYDAPADVVFTKFLANTGLLELLDIDVPFVIAPEVQHAHTWCVAGSGHGKTTALTSMLFEHLPEVLKGQSSIVLIDSQNVIIPALERLKVWEGSDRLIIVDPAEPVAFSLFDLPDTSGAMLNNALEMIDFVFAKLSESDTTYRQKNLFEYISEFLITAVPNATIHDFRDILDVKRAHEYEQYYENASSEVQDYLATDFVKEKFTLDARHQVVTKMRGMLRNSAFSQMFGSPKTKLNLFKELERGTCILIKPDKDQLGEDGTRLFGRFWIAQMKLVAQQRATTRKKTPTYFYIDECQDYLRGGDPKIESILEQARKQNMGLTLLHHYADQLKSHELVQLLGANTATKICGSLASSDLTRFASYMSCTPDFIKAQQPRRNFAVHVRGLTPTAVSLAFPFIDLTKEPRMSEAQWRAMRQRNKERYGAEPKEASVREAPQERELSDMELVISTARRLESLLVGHGATGKGLHEKLSSVEAKLTPEILKRGRYVATLRNKVVHEDKFALPDRDWFVLCGQIFEEYFDPSNAKRPPKEPSHVSPPVIPREKVKTEPKKPEGKQSKPDVNSGPDPDL